MEREKTSGTLDIIEKWFSKSPSHGFRRIGRAKTLPERLFWSYMLWIFATFMFSFISTVVSQYIAHPTVIHLRVQQDEDPEHFPAVTFCNINPLRDDGFLSDIRKNRLPSRPPAGPLNESEYHKAFAAYIERILADQAEGKVHPFVQWSYKLEDLLVTCSFNRRLCHRNLTLLFHPIYGNCYTFDHFLHVQQTEAEEIINDCCSEDLFGTNNFNLYLELFLHQQEYNMYLDDRAAFRIFIHRKHEVPMLSQTSLFVEPNLYTKLSFSQRLFTAHHNCRSSLTERMQKIFPENQVRYTQALCIKLCQEHFIKHFCHCIEPALSVFYQFYSNNQTQRNNSLPICSIDDECLTNWPYFDSKQLCGECLPECEIVQYRVQSSYATFPTARAVDQVWQRVQHHFHLDRNVTDYLRRSEGTPSGRRPILQGNILAVEISASPHVTEILTESPMYTWVDLISSIGGQTSLWIGISLINLVEITELFYSLIRHWTT